MINRSDCFAYVQRGNRGRCEILKNADCDCCSFFKTIEQYKEDLIKYPPNLLKYIPRKKQ